jgi:hypothetical protein
VTKRERQERRRVEPPPASDENHAWSRSSLAYWSAIGASVATVCGAVVAVVALVIPGPVKKQPPHGRLLARAFVINPREASYLDANQRAVQTLSSSPTIEALLQNETSDTVLLLSARVTIESYGDLAVCYLQGGGELPSANPLPIHLPAFPNSAERTITEHLHEQIPPGRSDRVVLRFAGSHIRYGLYRLHVELLTQRTGQGVSLGEFLLSTPDAFPRYGTYLPEDNARLNEMTRPANLASKVGRVSVLASTWCFRRNLSVVHQLVRAGAQHSPEIEGLEQPVLASRWSSVQDRRPARAAASILARNATNDESYAEDAVFAASETHDESFERQLRRTVGAGLIGTLKSLLREGAISPYTVDLARLAVSIEPSPEASQLLWQVKRRIGPGASE